MQFRALTWVLLALGVLLVALGVYYLVTPAGNLPSFLPGHLAGSTHHHTKHGIVAFGLAAAAFVGAWFTTTPSKSAG